MTPTRRLPTVALLFACLCMAACEAPTSGPRELDYHPSRVLVRWQAATLDNQKDDVRTSVGVDTVREYALLPELELLEVTQRGLGIEDARAQLDRKSAVVAYAELDYFVRSFGIQDDAHFARQWSMRNGGGDLGGIPGVPGADIEAAAGWAMFTGDPNFVIAVIDTGVQWNHPDLAGNVWQNHADPIDDVDDDGNGLVDDFRGWDFVSGDNDPDDPEGHGTHVAGIIGAVGNNATGVAGVNWACKIMPLRIMGSGRGSISDAIAALEYAVEHGAGISCNSWGDDDRSQALEDAIRAAGARDHLFVTSAGNRQRDVEAEPVYPAAFDLENILTVASTDHRDRLASKSNWGAVSVDLCAPGVHILSTSNDRTYRVLSGTSMAAAHVAGVAAMVAAHHDIVDPAEVRQKVLDTVRPVPALAGRTVTGGVVSLRGALQP